MQDTNFIIKGNICYSREKNRLEIHDNAYLICEDGISKGVYPDIPHAYRDFTLFDYTDKLIIPGLVDLHVHAPQYAFRGLGMDLELIDWLNTYTFKEEQKYKDLAYADKAYQIFADDLKHSATTRAVIFATIHPDATLHLMHLLEESGLVSYVGKVNMDRNSPDYLIEESVEKAIRDTDIWIKASQENFKRTKPILTPRFIPTCSDTLLDSLSDLQKTYHLPLQSHLSENLGEIEWVKELDKEARFYADAYHRHGLMDKQYKSIMAHCVYSSQEEIEMLKEENVFIAHCPNSNTNLSSGIAPIRTYLDMDMKVGLGTDVAGGFSISMFHAMVDALQVSKLRWRLQDTSLAPLNIAEVFYLATKGGGEFFGNVGSFEEGFEFDALVLDDSSLKHPQELDTKARLERFIYLNNEHHILSKFVQGRKIF